MRLRFVVLTFLMLTGLFCKFSYAENLDQVVAIVDDQIITASELGRIVGPIYYQYKNTYEGAELDQKMQQVQKDALKQLIENKLLLKEARSMEELEVSSVEIDKKINEIQERFASEEEFKALLKKDRTTIEELRSQIEEQLLTKKLLSMKVYAQLTVSPREVEKYYKENAVDFIESEKIKIYHIMLKKGDDVAAAKTKTEEALGLIKGGDSFEETAKKYSEGPHAEKAGDVGFFERGYMLKKIEDVAFGLDVGTYSDIIETPVGYHLVFLQSRKKGSSVELKDIWDKVEAKVYRSKVDKRYKDYISNLSRKTYVSIVRQ